MLQIHRETLAELSGVGLRTLSSLREVAKEIQLPKLYKIRQCLGFRIVFQNKEL